MTVFKKSVCLLLAAVFVTMVVGCEKEGTGEKAGREIDKAIDVTKEKFGDLQK